MKKLIKKDCGRVIRTLWSDVGATDGILIEVDSSGSGKIFDFDDREIYPFQHDQVVSKGKYISAEDTGLNG